MSRKGFYTVGGGGGGGDPSAPDIVIAEEIDQESDIGGALTIEGSQAQTSLGALGGALAIGDSAQTETTVSGVSGSLAGISEGINGGISGVELNFTDVRVMEDSYIDDGNPNDNFGTATQLLIQQGVVLAVDGYEALLLWDFSGWTGLEAIPGDDEISLEFYLAPPVIDVGADITFEGLVQASRPWDESTVTFNNCPAHPTDAGSYSYSLLEGGGDKSITLDNITVGDVLGNYLSLRINLQALIAVVGIFNIRSKEHGSGTYPRITFNARLAL